MGRTEAVRDLDAVAYLHKLMPGSDHPGVLCQKDGVTIHYWRDGSEIRWRQVPITETADIMWCIIPWSEMHQPVSSVRAAGAAQLKLGEEKEALVPDMKAELSGPSPDLDSVERQKFPLRSELAVAAVAFG